MTIIKKRAFLLTMILSLALLLGALGAISISAAESADILISATTNQSVKQGEKGRCHVYVSSLAGLSSLSVECHFDPGKISVSNLYVYNSVLCNLYDKSVSSSSIKFSYIFVGTDEAVKTKLFHFEYTVLPGADVGGAYFDIVVSEAYDSSLNEISVTGSRCSFTIAEGEKKETHSYTRKVIADEYKKSDATCTQKAVYFYCCATCNQKGSETFEHGDALGHTGGKATCSEKAKCVRCNQPYGEKGNHSYTDHDPKKIYLKTAATCTSMAVYYVNCATCDQAGTETFEFGDLLEHSYDYRVAKDIYLASAASCTKKAEYFVSCSCGAAGIATFEYGDKADHAYKAIICCSEAGHWRECSNCSATTDVEPHVPGNPATETTSQICTVCDYIIAQPIGHTHDYGLGWLSDSEIHWQECACSSKANKSVHNYDDGVVVKSATYDEEGEMLYSCTVCGNKKSEPIEKLIPPQTEEPETVAVTEEALESDTDTELVTSGDTGEVDNGALQVGAWVAVIIAAILVCGIVSVFLLRKKR